MTGRQARPAGVGECVGTRRAGELLGVDERTVVRWCDAGTLEVAYLTAGGHRRIALKVIEARVAAAAQGDEVPA